MTKIPGYTLDYYDKNVVRRIREKYGLEPLDAVRSFLTSEVHAMLEDAELSMWDFSDRAIFDMWEVEQITGDPRNSVYLRGE